ncbi:MAG: tetratricopeptide repeat protein [Acidobacteriota bacterium]
MKIHARIAVAALSLVTCFVPADVAAQQAGRVAGTVTTTDGEPIAGVRITISPVGLDTEMVKTSNKKGKFTVAHSDAAMTYTYTFEKEGFKTLVLEVKPPVGGTEVREFQLLPVATASAQGGDSAAKESSLGGGGPAVRAYNQGVEAQRVGNLEAAAENYREAFNRDPELAAAHTSLAAVLLSQKDYPAAAAEAEVALAVDADDVRAMQIRFDAYRLAGDDEQADEAAKALRKIGNLEDAATRIFNEGADAFNEGDIATAQSKFQQVIQLAPEMVPPYVALAQISLAQGSASEALAMAEAALVRDPDNLRALKIAYDGARLTGDTETANHVLDRLVELDPEWATTTLFEHAVKLYNDNQPEAAAAELEFVTRVDPEMAKAHFLLGMALFNSGKVDEGRAHLETFLELAPDDPDAEIARGILSFEQ